FGPPPPPIFGPDMLKKMNEFIFLSKISEETDGITGYDLQKDFFNQNPDTPNTTIYRTLRKLKKDGYLSTRQEVVKGRARKLYFISDLGLKRLKKLQGEIARKVSYLVPPEGFEIPFPHPPPPDRPHFFSKRLSEIQTKEDGFLYLKKIEDMLQNVQSRLKRRINNLQSHKEDIEDAVKQLKSLDNDEKEAIQEIFLKLKDKFIRNRHRGKKKEE
ncbi:MAG: hypothetical protein GF364_08650, partial [Candidatus Lokiarchaeota archaeon]|nr:hypothetical protein [Candidatus Lokiarchaeota archaeon]